MSGPDPDDADSRFRFNSERATRGFSARRARHFSKRWRELLATVLAPVRSEDPVVNITASTTSTAVATAAPSVPQVSRNKVLMKPPNQPPA